MISISGEINQIKFCLENSKPPIPLFFFNKKWNTLSKKREREKGKQQTKKRDVIYFDNLCILKFEEL